MKTQTDAQANNPTTTVINMIKAMRIRGESEVLPREYGTYGGFGLERLTTTTGAVNVMSAGFDRDRKTCPRSSVCCSLRRCDRLWMLPFVVLLSRSSTWLCVITAVAAVSFGLDEKRTVRGEKADDLERENIMWQEWSWVPVMVIR